MTVDLVRCWGLVMPDEGAVAHPAAVGPPGDQPFAGRGGQDWPERGRGAPPRPDLDGGVGIADDGGDFAAEPVDVSVECSAVPVGAFAAVDEPGAGAILGTGQTPR